MGSMGHGQIDVLATPPREWGSTSALIDHSRPDRSPRSLTGRRLRVSNLRIQGERLGGE